LSVSRFNSLTAETLENNKQSHRSQSVLVYTKKTSTYDNGWEIQSGKRKQLCGSYAEHYDRADDGKS